MSQNNAEGFLAKLEADATMKVAVKQEITGKKGNAYDATLVSLGAKYGFEFTQQEIAAARSQAISDRDLDGVAGGSEFDSCLPPPNKSGVEGTVGDRATKGREARF